MEAILEKTGIEASLRQLCQSIVDDPEFIEAHQRIELFLDSSDAQSVYRAWQEKAHALHMRSHEGDLPNDEELEEFERLRDAVESNSVASGFAEAEDVLNGLFGTVTKMVQKTLQLGRVPSEEDLAGSGCCGSGGGCGCSH
jgi:cell fate (sporulation/competence/biofilm development) regulator YlbF (YheA/YmcA/DUF963 family)